jgi:hypothetical protein
MASDNDPVASTGGQPSRISPEATGIQTEPAHGGATATATQAAPPAPPQADIPLPPARPRPLVVSPEQLALRLGRLDLLLVAVVLVLAFFLGSFAARNSDLLMHLASGRLQTKGEYRPWSGVDPFSYTTEGIYWANHSWLFDLITYGLYQMTTGAGLVIVKALLVVALAGVMLATRRPGRSLWIPAVCTGVALVALSPLLFLRSTVVSMLFLGVTLWLLQRPAADAAPVTASARKGRAPSQQPERRHLWLLVPLFLLWVNLDSWFLLGPITVALYGIGEFLQEKIGPSAEGDGFGARGQRTLVLVFLAGMAVCLVNPHHIHAFSLPAQLGLSGGADVLRSEREFLPWFRGSVEYYRDTNFGWNVAGITYFVLLLMGAASFALNYQDWRWGRALVWLALAALSVYHQRAMPFFAVAAGPITALNFQDAVARGYGTALRVTRSWREWSTGGRLVTLACGLALVAVAWPGWLHASWVGMDRSARRVTWRVEFDPSLRETAEQLQQWRTQGVIGKDDRGLSLSPDVANYCAWFCPEEKGFIDYRVALFGGMADTYVQLRKALGFEEVDPEGRFKHPSVSDVFGKYHINHLVLAYDDPIRARLPMAYFINDSQKRWTVVDWFGRALIVSWADPNKKDAQLPLGGMRYDSGKAAFGPEPVMAPAERPRTPEDRPWWELYVHERGPQPKNRHAAMMDILYFESRVPQRREGNLREALALSTTQLVAAPSLASGSLFHCMVKGTQFTIAFSGGRVPRLPATSAQLAQRATTTYLMTRDDGPASALWLAVRHFRLALAENPDDAQTHLRLQVAYQLLEERTAERAMGQLPQLRLIRQVQRISALTNAILLQPDLQVAQGDLAGIYEQLTYWDLALKHRKEELRLTQKLGRLVGESAEDYEERAAKLEEHVKRLDDEVKKRQNQYEVAQTSRSSVRNKAELAKSLGLAGQARDMLMRSGDVVLDKEAIQLQLHLMLTTGLIEGKDGIRDTLSEDNLKNVLGRMELGGCSYPAHAWLQILVAAASGDYLEADAKLESILAIRDRDHKQLLEFTTRNIAFRLITLDLSVPHQLPSRLWWSLERASMMDRLKSLKNAEPVKADIFVLRGVLALERGDNARAKRLFQEVLALKNRQFEPIAQYYLRLMEGTH